jgi:predicted kinase
MATSTALPTAPSVCYKPDMRKWMRERLKRRKKDPAKIEERPVPLQPAYFEPEATAPTASPDQPETAPAHQTPRDQIQAQELRAVQPSTQSKAGDPRRRRRRRGRGGRGRDAPPAQATPASPPAQVLHGEAAMPSVTEAQPLPERTPTPVVTHLAKLPAPKGVVVLAIGLPGSGKSSWFKRHNITPLSSDMLRSLLFDDPTEQRYQDLIFSNLRSMLKARLIARRPINYVDATNLSPHERQSWIKLAKDYGYEVHAVFFDVPLEVCLNRNQRRQRVVTEVVMRRMAAKLRPPAFDEGFTKITVVRVKQTA